MDLTLISYGDCMSEENQTRTPGDAVERVLRDGLAKGDVLIASSRPILRHLLANGDQSLFSDEVLARVRGILSHLAEQLLFAYAQAAETEDERSLIEHRQPDLTRLLVEETALLSHVHVLTIEAVLADQLQKRSGIDTVLSPLLQELVASPDGEMAASAMRVLAAQARFMQQMRRMDLPVRELPGDLFAKALELLRCQSKDDAVLERAETCLRDDYEASATRLGQLSRLVMAMGHKAPRALSIDHAGLALFSTALAMASDRDRNDTILSYGENQVARLALALRAAGLKQPAVEEQFMYLHPDAALPDGFGTVTTARAAAMLGSSRPDSPA